jgi:uncharacterized protein YbjT (DUF2867 family)
MASQGNSPAPDRPLIAIAGGSGFVGTFLRSDLSGEYRFRALTRSPTIAAATEDQHGNEWRHCDLYSLPMLTEALRGCDYGIYLVHSMAPSSRLVQSNFADLDLLLADNFIRAAEAAGVRHVVYLGGLIPEGEEAGLSPHLASRLEVEHVLRSRSIPVTSLRAGLIFGPGGSSFTMLIRLVQRLPVMILPRWCRSRTHSVDIHDVVRAFDLALGEESLRGGTYDLGGHAPMTYRELILETARILGRRVRFVQFPFNAFGLSKRWVSLFGGIPTELVGPLLESLTHDLTARPNPLLDRLLPEAVSFEESLRSSTDENGRPLPNPRRDARRQDRGKIKRDRKVRSVQRMPMPPRWTADQVRAEYGRWLTRTLGGIIQVRVEADGSLDFRLFPLGLLLLRLEPTPYSREGQRRRAYYIKGGLLTRDPDPAGRFEFRLFEREGFLIASIHGFQPSLPWWLYAHTQAYVHLAVMRLFGRHLGRIGAVDRAAPPPVSAES